MNHEVKKIDEKEFLKTFSGMLKFTYNNKNGILDLERCASFLAQTKQTIVELLKVFEESEIIKVSKNVQNGETKDCKIEFLLNTEISKVLHASSYKEFLSQIRTSQDYKTSLLEAELNNFCN